MIKVVRVELIPCMEGLTKKEVYGLLLSTQKEAVEIANKLARTWYLKTAEAFDIYKKEKALDKKAKMSPILKEMLGGKSMLSYLGSLYALKNLPEDEQYSVSTRCVAALIQSVLKKMNALNKDILTCKASLPTYRSTMPVPFANDLYNISDRVGGGYNIELNVYNKAFSVKANMPTRFLFYTGKLNKYQKPILDRIIDGSYKQGQGDIILKKGKIFLNIMYNNNTDVVEKEQNGNTLAVIFSETDNNIVLGAYSGEKLIRVISIPTDNVNRFRVRYERLRQDKKGNMYASNKGRGIKDMFKKSLPYAVKWSNFQNTFNHKVSKTIIRYAEKYDVGQILLEDVNGVYASHKKLGQYKYYELSEKISYKAKEAGISFNTVKISRKDLPDTDDKTLLDFLLNG